MMRVGVFVFGSGDPSPYGRLLKTWARGRKDVHLFTDNAVADNDLHYLRFSHLNAEQPFDLILYDVDDTADHAAAFPFIAKHPGILYCNDIRLWRFARAVSHEPRDPWGTGWIFNTAAPEQALRLAECAEQNTEPGSVIEEHPLVEALASRSTGVVVPNAEMGKCLKRDGVFPPVNIIGNVLSKEQFAAVMEHSLPIWKELTTPLRRTLHTIEHPFHDLYEVERGRVVEKYGYGSEDQMTNALENLRELFEGATNSATAQRGEDE